MALTLGHSPYLLWWLGDSAPTTTWGRDLHSVLCPRGPTEQWVGHRLLSNLSSTAGKGSPKYGALTLKESGALAAGVPETGRALGL